VIVVNEVPYNLLWCILSLTLGGFVGLAYSYNKYVKPYVEGNIDRWGLISGILGGVLFSIPLPYNINYPLSLFLLGIPLGMRPGYGRVELILGVSIAVLGYLIRGLIGR